MTTDIVDVKAALTEGLTELRLPTVKRIYEESARFAERDTLSYERYLLDLVTRESQDRQQKRIERLLRASRIPAEKALANFNLKRIPPKVALLTNGPPPQRTGSYVLSDPDAMMIPPLHDPSQAATASPESTFP